MSRQVSGRHVGYGPVPDAGVSTSSWEELHSQARGRKHFFREGRGGIYRVPGGALFLVCSCYIVVFD